MSDRGNVKEADMKRIIAVDPGAGGGIAWVDGESRARAIPMPEGMTAQVDTLRDLYFDGRGQGVSEWSAVIERVGGYVPGNSGPSACKFARHCGHVEATLYNIGIPFDQVAPAVWMKSLGALPKDKGERKRAIKELMARRYPHIDVTLKTADALGILTWAIQREWGNA